LTSWALSGPFLLIRSRLPDQVIVSVLCGENDDEKQEKVQEITMF
jgi:hypothetical protein